LSRAAGAAVSVLSAAYDLVVIETTGVGQSETDIEHVADTVVMVIQPGSGDVLQFLKAGIIEIPDLFVVNKADLGDIATRARGELLAALTAVHSGANDFELPAVIATCGTSGDGLPELLDAVDAHRQRLARDGRLEARRVTASAAWGLRLLLQRYGEYGIDRAGGPKTVQAALEQAIGAGASPVEAASRIAERCRCAGPEPGGARGLGTEAATRQPGA
jgi:LAO/AO transport system kinase